MRNARPLLALTMVLMVLGCRRQDDAWTTQILAPLVKTEMGLDNLIADSFLVTNADGSYNLAYTNEIKVDSFDDYLVVPDTVQKVTVTLQKLILDDRSFTDTITLAQIDPAAVLLHGKMVDLPAQDYSDATDPQTIDVSEQFFKTATFRSGFLDVTIHNDLPVEVEIMVFKLSNQNDGSLVIQDTFRNILPYSSASKSIDLAGKTVNGVLLAELIRVKTKASNGQVLVDAYKGVRVELGTRDLEPESATAVFPAQNLVTDTQEVIYDLGEAKVTEMRIRSGKVIMEVFSTIEEEIVLDYTIPQSGYEGDFNQPIVRQFRVPPAKRGETQVIKQEFPIDDYVVRYKGKDPSVAPFYNAVYSKLIASIEYSGIERSISLHDSVYVRFGLVDVIPEYAIGDFGTKTVQLKDTIDIKAFENVTGTLSLEDVSMWLTVENGFGIEANLTVNSLVAANTRAATDVALTYANLIGNTILIARAWNPPLTPNKQSWVINKSNSNIKSFVENMPDKLVADFEVETRPNGSNDFQDFVFHQSQMKAILNLFMPVKFGVANLTLQQKEKFDIRDIKDHERISSGEFTLVVENPFPLGAEMAVDFLDDQDTVLLTLFSGQRVESGVMIPGKDSTSGSVESRIKAEVTEQQMDMIRESVRVRIRATFDSPDSDRHAIYSTYRLKAKLIGNFNYEQHLQ